MLKNDGRLFIKDIVLEDVFCDFCKEQHLGKDNIGIELKPDDNVMNIYGYRTSEESGRWDDFAGALRSYSYDDELYNCIMEHRANGNKVDFCVDFDNRVLRLFAYKPMD